MKLANVKNPITGGNLSLSPMGIAGLIGGMIVMILAFGFAQFGATWIKSKMPAGAAQAANGSGGTQGINWA